MAEEIHGSEAAADDVPPVTVPQAQGQAAASDGTVHVRL